MATVVREAPHHDNTVCVQWYKCELPECRDRLNARRRALRAGTVQPSRILVDATPVRQHILELQDAGLSPRRIAVLAGLSHTTICAFLRARPSVGRGRKRYTTPETAAKILAVRPVTAVGVLRRIHALVAIGWPARKVAARAGVSVRWLVEVRDTTAITMVNTNKITAAYEELRHLKPEKNGVWPGHASRARKRAADNRWPTPQYWDQHPGAIDDPHFEPMYRLTRREIVAQDAHWVMSTLGVDRGTAAQRLGVSRDYIDHAFRDHPQYAVGVAA